MLFQVPTGKRWHPLGVFSEGGPTSWVRVETWSGFMIVRVVVWVYRGSSLSCKGVVPKIPEKLQDGGWLS